MTHAQTLTTLAPGTRIRLVLVDSLRQGPVSPARQILVGTLIRTTNDSVWLQPRGAAAFSVSRAAIRGARASRGVSRVRSAVTFGVGLGLTAVAFQLAKNDSHDDVFGVGGVAFGVGAVLGASSPFEQWRRVRR
ncbi:MAG: hypothetical protein ACO1Q7_07095 [Gemmatimonas sp.]